MTMTPTTTCLFSVLCIARCGLKLGVGEKKKPHVLGRNLLAMGHGALCTRLAQKLA
jgi:hypothetical protein